MKMIGIAATIIVGLAGQAAGQMVHWDLSMYETLPRPEQVERATTVKELQRYLTSETVGLLQWMAMLRIAEIGGDEAVDALYEFYQRADSSCGDDSGQLPKAGAVRLLGTVGGERSKTHLLAILSATIRKMQGGKDGPLTTQVFYSAVRGLGAYWDDAEVYGLLRGLSTNPPEPARSVKSRWAEEVLLRMDMRRAGIDTLPLEEQVRFLLERVRSPGFGGSTIVGQGRWTHEAVVTEAIDWILCDDFGSHILPIVEEYAVENDSLLDSRAKDGLRELMGSLRVLPQLEGLRRQEIERAREGLGRPGTRLVVKEDGRGKWMEAVPVDTSAVEPDRRGEDEGWRQFFLGLASRPHSTSRDRAWAYRALALTAAKAGQWDLALEYYERMEKEDYEHAFTTEVDIAKEKEALRQRRYPGP